MSDNDVELQKAIGKLWGAVERSNGDIRELRVALVGIDNTNGLRGELRDFIKKFDGEFPARMCAVEDRVEEGIAYGKHLYEVERHQPGECLGKAALEKYIAEQQKRSDDNTKASIEMNKARMAMIGMIVVSLISALASIFVALQKVPTP